jgi:hypothetical protein
MPRSLSRSRRLISGFRYRPYVTSRYVTFTLLCLWFSHVANGVFSSIRQSFSTVTVAPSFDPPNPKVDPLRGHADNIESFITGAAAQHVPDVRELVEGILRRCFESDWWQQNARDERSGVLDQLCPNIDGKHECRICRVMHSTGMAARKCLFKHIDYKPR